MNVEGKTKSLAAGHVGAPTGEKPATVTLLRMLVVDCDAMSRRGFVASLKEWGVSDVRVAKDAIEALKLWRTTGPFELVLCDAMFPSTRGMELIATLRTEGERAPILVVSSQRTLDTLAQALEVGVDDYLQKPVHPDDLRNAISLLLSRSIERERSGGHSEKAPLFGATARVEAHGTERTLALTAMTHSLQLESFQGVCERFAAIHLSSVERLHLHLALEEILQNAREWGNRFDPAKRIRFTFTPLKDRVCFSIEDEGAGFDPASIPDPSINPKEHILRRMASGKRIGGWGLFIARKRMDDVSFSEKGNRVHITKLFKQACFPATEA